MGFTDADRYAGQTPEQQTQGVMVASPATKALSMMLPLQREQGRRLGQLITLLPSQLLTTASCFRRCRSAN